MSDWFDVRDVEGDFAMGVRIDEDGDLKVLVDHYECTDSIITYIPRDGALGLAYNIINEYKKGRIINE